MRFDQRAAKIELILSDVDGVLTDGGIAYDNQGIEYKQFHVRDGLGIKLWQRVGWTFGLLTARTSHIVRVRAAELGIDLIRQGFDDKLPVAQQIIEQMRLSPEQVCYIGDDLADIPLIQYVGLGVAVGNAANDARAVAHHVTATDGGKGAVRELIEMILKAQGRWDEVLRRYTGG